MRSCWPVMTAKLLRTVLRLARTYNIGTTRDWMYEIIKWDVHNICKFNETDVTSFMALNTCTCLHLIHLELDQALLIMNHWGAFETRYCGFHPPSWSATQRHSLSDVLMASLTPLYVMSATPSAAKHWLSTQREPTEYPVSRPDPRSSLISRHANLNSMIQQYWIHRFFHCVKWAQVWRTSHARARHRQWDAWSCRGANTTLRGCSDEPVKPSLVPSGVYYSFFKTCCL